TLRSAQCKAKTNPRRAEENAAGHDTVYADSSEGESQCRTRREQRRGELLTTPPVFPKPFFETRGGQKGLLRVYLCDLPFQFVCDSFGRSRRSDEEQDGT